MDNPPQQNRAPKIFISYRRRDAPGYAGRLYDSLKRELGEDKLFRDVDSIRGGDNFREKIEKAVSSCEVLLAVIGPNWNTDENGVRRLDKEDDFVRIEIEAALKRNIRVIPVLVQETPLPQELPQSLTGLTDRQAVELDDNRWDYDVESLIEVIKDAIPKTGPLPTPPPPEDRQPAPSPQPRSSLGPWLLAASGVLLLGIVLLLFMLWIPRGGNVNSSSSNTTNNSNVANRNSSPSADNGNKDVTNSSARGGTVVANNTPIASQPSTLSGEFLNETSWTYTREVTGVSPYIIKFNADRTFYYKKLDDADWIKRPETGKHAYGYWKLIGNNKIHLTWHPYDSPQEDEGEFNGILIKGEAVSGSPYYWTATKRD